MALIKVPLDADLYIEGDPDDPAVANMIEAIRQHSTITVDRVNVAFDGLYQEFWKVLVGGQEVRLVVRTGRPKSSRVILTAGPGQTAADIAAVMEMVTRRTEDGHVLFTHFGDRKALREFLAALGVENVPMTASGLDHMKASGVAGDKKLWTRSGAFDLTVFVELAESDEAGAFWGMCRDDVRNVGGLKIRLMQDVAVRLRQQQVV